MSGEGILKQVNSTPITAEEMTRYLKAMEADTGTPSFERGVFIAREVFNKDTQKCLSVNMRMTALSKLIESQSLPGWVKSQQSDGSFEVAANIYVAAGQEPMIESGNDWGFNLDSLLQRAFNLGKINA